MSRGAPRPSVIAHDLESFFRSAGEQGKDHVTPGIIRALLALRVHTLSMRAPANARELILVAIDGGPTPRHAAILMLDRKRIIATLRALGDPVTAEAVEVEDLPGFLRVIALDREGHFQAASVTWPSARAGQA